MFSLTQQFQQQTNLRLNIKSQKKKNIKKVSSERIQVLDQQQAFTVAVNNDLECLKQSWFP